MSIAEDVGKKISSWLIEQAGWGMIIIAIFGTIVQFVAFAVLCRIVWHGWPWPIDWCSDGIMWGGVLVVLVGINTLMWNLIEKSAQRDERKIWIKAFCNIHSQLEQKKITDDSGQRVEAFLSATENRIFIEAIKEKPDVPPTS